MGTTQHRHLCSPSCPLERRPATAWLTCVTYALCPACQRLLSMATGCKWDKLVQQWHISWHLICAHTEEVWSDMAQQGPTASTSMQQGMSSSRVAHTAHTMLQGLPGNEGYCETSTGGMNCLQLSSGDAKWPCWKGRPKHTAQHRYAGDWHVAIKKPSESSKSHWYMEILAWEIFSLAAHLLRFKAGELLSNFSSQEGPWKQSPESK